MHPIVHIGYPKTASTWFQEDVYPHVTSHQFVPPAIVRQSLLTPHAFDWDAEEARARLSSSAGLPPVICEEELTGYIHNGGLNGHLTVATAHRIRDILPDAHIVIFIRSQVEMINAVYLQYVRGGGTFGPDRYLYPHWYLRGHLAKPHKVPRFSFTYFEYDRLISCYDSLFGSGNVHVFLYEELRNNRDEVLAEVLAKTGLSLRTDCISQGRRNVSYSPAIVRLALLMNKMTVRDVLDKRALLNFKRWNSRRKKILESLNASGRFGRPSTPQQTFGDNLAQTIANRFRRSNSRLKRLRPDLRLDYWNYPVLENDEDF